jgi:hypothetical protein
MSSSIKNGFSPLLGLIGAFALVNFSILLKRKKERFNILSYHKVLNRLAVSIPLMANCVLFSLKKSFSKYKFKRFLSGIDFPKPILQTWCV